MIKKKVDKLIHKFKTNNPFEIIDSYKNIILCKISLDTDINGLYQYHKGVKFIYINSNLSIEKQTVVCAHELGHALLHTKINVCFFKENTFFSTSKFEVQANMFAAELLLPDSLIQRYPNYTLEQIALYNNLDVCICKFKNM